MPVDVVLRRGALAVLLLAANGCVTVPESRPADPDGDRGGKVALSPIEAARLEAAEMARGSWTREASAEASEASGAAPPGEAAEAESADAGSELQSAIGPDDEAAPEAASTTERPEAPDDTSEESTDADWAGESAAADFDAEPPPAPSVTQRQQPLTTGPLDYGNINTRFQQLRLQQSLRQSFNVTQLSDRSIRLGIASDSLFEFNSAEPIVDKLAPFDRIADLVRSCGGYVLHVVGHTDDFGEEGANRWISHARAISVARYLMARGVPAWRIQHEGRGSSEPLIPNPDPADRKLNRRVDVVIKPVIAGREEEAWMPPLPMEPMP